MSDHANTHHTADDMLAKLASSQEGNTSGVAHFDRSFIPVERVGNPEDMGGTIVYLASKAGAYLTGSILVIDGGRFSIMPASY